MNKHLGSCLCGQISYELEGDFDGFFLCHCTHCQKDTGSAHAANLFSSNMKLNWKSGEQNVTTFKLPNTRHQKSFCATCSSALPNSQRDGKILVVPAGGLDTPVPIQPTAHIFYGSKASWEDGLEQFRKFETFPG